MNLTVLGSSIGREREVADGLAVAKEVHFRVAAHMAHQTNFVDHHFTSLMLSFLPRSSGHHQPGKGGLQPGILFFQILFHFGDWRIAQEKLFFRCGENLVVVHGENLDCRWGG